MRANGHGTISPVGTVIMYICICRKHSEHCSGKTPCIQGQKSPSSGSRVIGKRLGESLYNYVAVWTLSSSVAKARPNQLREVYSFSSASYIY